jgi:DNA repair exonuclease SbcCD nuclease subunit
LHTALEGHSAHKNYAPCSIGQLEARGYQYWALGHVHDRWIHEGKDATIAFPGNLQGRHVRETGPRGALLVTASADVGIESIEPLDVDVLRWELLTVDVSGSCALSDVVGLVGRSLEKLLEGAQERPVAVRVALRGSAPVHGALFGLETQLRAEVLSQAATLGSDRLWIEKVVIQTSPAASVEQVAARADAVADLQALMTQAQYDKTFLASLQDDFAQLLGKTSPEVIAAVPALEAIRVGDLKSLVESTAPTLIAYLATTGDAQ